MDGAAGWLHFAALIAVWGAVSGRWLIAPRTGEATRAALAGTARRIGLWAAIALVAAMGLAFRRQLAAFRDPFVPWQEDAALLLATDWGGAWLLGTVGAALLPMLFSGIRTGAGAAGNRSSQPALWPGATVVAGGLCAIPAFTGHAAGTGELRWLSIPVDILHVLAAGSWIGGLFLVLAADRVARGRESVDGENRAEGILAEVVPLFSPVALVSAGALIATGAASAFLQIESASALFGTAYGRLLVAKVALVALVMALGAVNWRRLTPLLRTAEGGDALRRNAMRELAVAQLVILVTALLVRTSPMGG